MRTNKTNPKECGECKVLLSVAANSGHLRGCSQYVALAPAPYGKDGFVRNANGAIAGFATANIAEPLAIGLNGWLKAVTTRKVA